MTSFPFLRHILVEYSPKQIFHPIFRVEKGSFLLLFFINNTKISKKIHKSCIWIFRMVFSHKLYLSNKIHWILKINFWSIWGTVHVSCNNCGNWLIRNTKQCFENNPLCIGFGISLMKFFSIPDGHSFASD
jgi:hypothetical protein